MGARAVSWTATSLDFYIELHLHRVKFKFQFTWSCPECLSLGSQQDVPTECVSCLSTDLRLSHPPSQQFPHIGVPSPSPSGWLFISSGWAARLMLKDRWVSGTGVGKARPLAESRKGVCPQAWRPCWSGLGMD